MLPRLPFLLLAVAASQSLTVRVVAQAPPSPSLQKEVEPFLRNTCWHCHDAGTETRLNLDELGYDLSQPHTFRQWEAIFDRIDKGEMPPASEERPAAADVDRTLALLRRNLHETNRTRQETAGRVASRRLTRLEYENTLRDLFQIEEDLAASLPEESDTGGFDTVGLTQRTSAVHVSSYLTAADRVLSAAIQLGPRPETLNRPVDYVNSKYVARWYDEPLELGGNVIKRLDAAVGLLVDLDYIMRTDANGLTFQHAGLYRIRIEAYAHQSKAPLTLKLIRASELRGGAAMLAAFDIAPDEPRTVEVTARLVPGDYLYPSIALERDKNLVYRDIVTGGGARNYRGEVMAIKSFHVEGPLHESWPPPSTRRLFSTMDVDEQPDGSFALRLTKERLSHVREVVAGIAPRLFRRPTNEAEIESFVQLAKPALEAGRPFVEAVRLPLSSMLTSPQFLFFESDPGALDDFALASRLSYFLWKSLPDGDLYQLAESGKLRDPTVLAQQVDRMLDDPRSQRFVSDFVGQWLRLYDVNATTPDENLYPEFDDVLNQALVQETELFFAELVKENLSVGNLIDSDFTFLNRRLARHYGIPDVKGQFFRRVTLPAESPRGGVLTQASVLKTTANGTVTSPVVRGNYVLTNLLGTPPNPPPPNVGSIEPDTRGTTTIRELLAAHRDIETCAQCHREIDPPGFALESFDPIGGYRTRYRASGRSLLDFFGNRSYHDGPRVDASGVTADGQGFSGIIDFKRHLVAQKEQIARHFISQLVVYATGAEIQFSDRERISAIVEATRSEQYPLRTILHEVVQSSLFRNK